MHTRLPVARPTTSPGARSSQCTLPGAAWTDAPLTCEALTEAQLASAEAEAKAAEAEARLAIAKARVADAKANVAAANGKVLYCWWSCAMGRDPPPPV